jgi:hypothetical protein
MSTDNGGKDYAWNVVEAHKALNDSHDEFGILQAQVHATLALAAAVQQINDRANRRAEARKPEVPACSCEGGCRPEEGGNYLRDHQPCSGGMHMTWSENSGTYCGRCQ